ncbi:MAG TPA: response regulator [Verrucomicrobiae bacterium]|jgi:PAS domain S-box-containing protein|nr:response regulator [Verrucomicrobiae bacterium]
MSSRDLPENKLGQGDELRRQLTALRAELSSQQWLLDALESQSAQYRALFELMPGSVVLVDSKGYIRDANPCFCRAMNYTREELVGLHVTQISQEKSEVIEQNIRRMMAGEILQHEVTNVQKDGSLRFYELREAAVTLPDGSMNILAVSNDVTDRKRAEQAKLDMERQLLRAQKLDSLGALAGGIAHDFNNLLAVILSNTELAMSDLPVTSPAQNCLTNALLAGKRAAELTRQMLAYSGRGRFVTVSVDLSKLARDMSDLLQVSISKSVRVELNLAPGLPPIQADAEQIQQVLMNLVTNASEAIGEKPGVVAITTTVREFDAAHLAETRTNNRLAPGRYAVLEVSDTGCGMDDTVRGNLFDPFFTTKFLGRGLGMSAVLGIVQGHRGAIMVSSKPRKGTVVSVLFPVAERRSNSPVSEPILFPASPKPAVSLSGIVLVADDELQVRSLMEMLLKRMGFRVLSATDGEQAVELFRQHAPEITFVLIDLTMPNLDGARALSEIRRIRPTVKVVLTSGYNSEDLMSRYQNDGLDAFIQKPCDVETFQRVVQQVCAAPSPSSEHPVQGERTS